MATKEVEIASGFILVYHITEKVVKEKEMQICSCSNPTSTLAFTTTNFANTHPQVSRKEDLHHSVDVVCFRWIVFPSFVFSQVTMVQYYPSCIFAMAHQTPKKGVSVSSVIIYFIIYDTPSSP